jgi:hypothetical protein
MKEVRVQDAGTGIIINLLCCDTGFCIEGKKIENQICFFPSEAESSIKFRCLKCGQTGEICYSDGIYELMLPGLRICYDTQGGKICLSGRCHCQNNALRDDFTKKTCGEHCVEATQPGRYPFSCPCRVTYIVFVREDHFHIRTDGECPMLAIKQSEKK